jgi:hypothetical protein
MQSFFEMSELLENFEYLQESAAGLARIIDRIAGDADEAIKPYIAQVIQKGYKGGVHSLADLEKGAADKKKLHAALHYLAEKDIVDFGENGTFKVADINAHAGTGGSALKGAKAGVLSRKMLGHGDGQKTHGEYGSKLDQVKAKYPKHARTFDMIFASPNWKQMMAGKPYRAEDIAPGVDPGQLMGALDVLRHEEIVGFAGEPKPDTIVKARKYADAVENDLDRAAKQFPQYAQVFQAIMKTGAWRRLQGGSPILAANLLGVGASGGDFNANVELQLKALMALKHMGIIHFEGDKPTLKTPVTKGAGEVDAANAYKGPNRASDAAQAMAGAESKPGTRLADKQTVVSGQNKMHGGSAQEKMAPGKVAAAAGMYQDDPTQAISREWWHGWTTAMQAVERDPTLWNNEKWLGQLQQHTVTTLQNIAGQIKRAIDGGAPREQVKPMLTNFFMIASPNNSEHKPIEMFPGIAGMANKLKALYDGAYKRTATVPGY